MWRRLAEAWAHVRRCAADMWKPVPYSPCAFSALHHHFQPPCGVLLRRGSGIGRQARLRWLWRWRTIATVCVWGVWRRLSSRLAGSGKMEGSGLAVCGLPHTRTKSGCRPSTAHNRHLSQCI